jgi:hypothetical protein
MMGPIHRAKDYRLELVMISKTKECEDLSIDAAVILPVLNTARDMPLS